MKKRIVYCIIPVALMFCGLIAELIVIGSKTSIVIQSGIRSYNSITKALWIFVALMLVVFVVMVVIAVVKRNEPEEIEEKKMTEDERKDLYRKLASLQATKWRELTGVKAILGQLDDMNEYQSNLNYLLDQTSYLTSKPIEIVQRIEDCMYTNVGKLVNYLQVMQRKDMELVGRKMQECTAKNLSLLQKVRDFVVALIEYVNNDKGHEKEQDVTDYVNSYMYVVLDAIEKEDIKLT